ncbi:MAG TPA: ankyrin repeat domain-containing protein [Thiobacillaceae bacterium]|nr:ankyrin repeat domain-containing protein [Thiobacillaceae bacterium]
MSEQLHDAVRAGEVARARELIAAGADANARDSYGATPLMNAAHGGNVQMVRALIAAGADVNAVDDLGWNAIHKAVYNSDQDRGFDEVVDVLAKAGCDVNAKIGYGIRPLMLAAGYGEAAVCQTLLENGADVLARNDGGLTALMMVKDKFYVEVINLLHAAEQDAGVGEGSCASKNAPGSNVVTFLKPLAKNPNH